jgi:hypothetical protein
MHMRRLMTQVMAIEIKSIWADAQHGRQGQSIDYLECTSSHADDKKGKETLATNFAGIFQGARRYRSALKKDQALRPSRDQLSKAARMSALNS